MQSACASTSRRRSGAHACALCSAGLSLQCYSVSYPCEDAAPHDSSLMRCTVISSLPLLRAQAPLRLCPFPGCPCPNDATLQ